MLLQQFRHRTKFKGLLTMLVENNKNFRAAGAASGRRRGRPAAAVPSGQPAQPIDEFVTTYSLLTRENSTQIDEQTDGQEQAHRHARSQ